MLAPLSLSEASQLFGRTAQRGRASALEAEGQGRAYYAPLTIRPERSPVGFTAAAETAIHSPIDRASRAGRPQSRAGTGRQPPRPTAPSPASLETSPHRCPTQ